MDGSPPVPGLRTGAERLETEGRGRGPGSFLRVGEPVDGPGPAGRPPGPAAAQASRRTAQTEGQPTGPTPGVAAARAFGFSGEIWARGRIAQVIRQKFGVSYHPSQVGRLLKECGFSQQKPALRASQRDEEAIGDWRDRRFPELKKGRSRRQDHPVGRRIGSLPAPFPAAHLCAGGPDPGDPPQAEP